MKSHLRLLLLLAASGLSAHYCAAQHTAIGLRTGALVRAGITEPDLGLATAAQMHWNKEAFVRRRLSGKWTGDLSLGHFHHADHFVYNSPDHGGERLVDMHAFSLALSLEYNLLKPGDAKSSRLFAGWGIVSQHAFGRVREGYTGIDGRFHISDKQENRYTMLTGPELTFTKQVAPRFSLLAKAFYRLDVVDYLFRDFGREPGHWAPVNAGFSAGLFYSF